MAQRYTDPLALARMDDGRCPECGGPPGEHDGTGGNWGCLLTDTGVTARIARFRQDAATQAEPDGSI